MKNEKKDLKSVVAVSIISLLFIGMFIVSAKEVDRFITAFEWSTRMKEIGQCFSVSAGNTTETKKDGSELVTNTLSTNLFESCMKEKGYHQ